MLTFMSLGDVLTWFYRITSCRGGLKIKFFEVLSYVTIGMNCLRMNLSDEKVK